MKLYSYFRSSAAYRVRIAFNLKGLRYDTVSIHLQREGGMNRKPAYRAINPQMRVPALRLEFRRAHHPVARHHRISRRDPSAAAAVAARSRRARPGAGAGAADGLRHPSAQQCGTAALPQERARPGPGQDRCLVPPLGPRGLRRARGDGHGPGPYCFGADVTLADLCLVPQVANARRLKVPLDSYPGSSPSTRPAPSSPRSRPPGPRTSRMRNDPPGHRRAGDGGRATAAACLSCG